MLRRRSLNGVLAAMGLGTPDTAHGRNPDPQALFLEQNGWMPNNPRLPVLVYRGILNPAGNDLTRTFAGLFTANGWPPQWVNGVFLYHHYHSTAHEVLGFARGKATLMLGGEEGREIVVRAGDVVVLPTGTGHCEVEASDDFEVVGAYPPDQRWDICRLAPVGEARERMESLPFPESDPVSGAGGPLTRLWQKT